jgi:peptide/nickel transport system permease protein
MSGGSPTSRRFTVSRLFAAGTRSPMLAFILRRMGQALIVLLTVALIAFTLFRFVGDPTQQMTSQDTSLEERLKLRAELGLDDSFIVQFGRFVGNAATFDFGASYQTKQPVAKLIAERFPATMELAFVSALFALLVGIPMGVYTGLKPHSWLARLFQLVSLIGISLPTFLIGILLIFTFSVSLGWLPSFGRQGVVSAGGWTTSFLTIEGWRSIILPAITLGLFQMTLIMRLVRSEMMEVLRTDFVKFAKARGLKPRAIHFRHALKNTLIPVITITGLQLGSIIAFAIITETVFQWPGMGLMFLQAVQTVDIPIMAAYLMLVATLFVTINLIVDLLYVSVDPRIRIAGKAA